MTKIIGISAFYHDSAASLIEDGVIIAAAQEERFSRKKHDDRFPKNAIKFLLENSNCSLNEIDKIIFYEKPFLKFERLLETYLAFAPRGFRSFAAAIPLWIKEKLFQKYNLIKSLESIFGDEINWSQKLLFSEHHISHAASAFYPSPYNTAAVLTLDGVGEWTTTSLAVGNGKTLKVIKEMRDENISYNKISNYLNDLEIPSKNKSKWYSSSVRSVYLNGVIEKFCL